MYLTKKDHQSRIHKIIIDLLLVYFCSLDKNKYITSYILPLHIKSQPKYPGWTCKHMLYMLAYATQHAGHFVLSMVVSGMFISPALL